jgi:hypothetical protein
LGQSLGHTRPPPGHECDRRFLSEVSTPHPCAVSRDEWFIVQNGLNFKVKGYCAKGYGLSQLSFSAVLALNLFFDRCLNLQAQSGVRGIAFRGTVYEIGELADPVTFKGIEFDWCDVFLQNPVLNEVSSAQNVPDPIIKRSSFILVQRTSNMLFPTSIRFPCRFADISGNAI